MLVSANARVEPRLDIRADPRLALGYSDSGLFGSSVLWSLLSTWCGAEVCMLGWAYVVATDAWRASNKKKGISNRMNCQPDRNLSFALMRVSLDVRPFHNLYNKAEPICQP